MKIKESTLHYLQLMFAAMLTTGFAAVNAQAGATQEMDHHSHAMHKEMQGHDSMMNASMADHSQHMKALESMQNEGYQRSIGSYTLPTMELVDMQGKPVRVDKILDTDQPLMLNFIYTSCTTICPVMSATFLQAQKQMGEKAKPVKWVSISIDPEYDTPARLREYAERFHAGSNWQFITGDLDRIIRLQKAFGVYHGSKMNHRPVTFLRAGRDQPWVRLDGLTSGAELVAEYQQLAQQ